MSASPSTKGARPAFPIVGLGASAGGLAPTAEILRLLGATPGVAVVVVHHLDPTHESGLVDILSRSTTMPVEAAHQGAVVEPNRVYVVPPNAALTISRGRLEVGPRVEDGRLHLPIDRFLESLAVEAASLAVGVVLSGSGFDGSAGIKAIKREAGITFAQDSTAGCESMPQSAIATGCVDFILSPSEIAREITRIGAHPAPPTPAALPAAPEPGYLQILAAVRRATGVDFASYKQTTVRRRLERRMFLRRLSTLAEYLEVLQREPDELRALCEDVLIHVTSFFREPEAFEALQKVVFPRLCEGRSPDSPLRIWVPGCSTGEEVYSIAIGLLEFLSARDLPSISVKIFGTDLSLATIDRARAGQYPPSIERDVSAERLERFFSRVGGAYQIRRDVRDLCVFAQHDLTRDPPFSSMDLVSCRNLMIYLGPSLQDRVIALLHYALKEPGFLLLGTSETVRAFPGFAPLDGKNKIYVRTSSVPRVAFDFATPSLRFESIQPASAAAQAERAPGTRPVTAPDIHREADRLLLAELAPPGVVVTDDLAIVQFRGQTGPFLEPTPGVASLDLLRMAREELRLPLRQAIDEARATRCPARTPTVALLAGEVARRVGLRVLPFSTPPNQQRFFLVLFEDGNGPAIESAPEARALDAPRQELEGQLRLELASTRQYLESVIEQAEVSNEELKAANEEVVSSNEELRSTNEELQSAKEELQATNEELRTVNDEMRERNVEATRLSDDLTNVLSSLEIPILILGRDSRIRRFTSAAERLFGLSIVDVGRPVASAPGIVAMAPTLPHLLQGVFDHLAPAECSAQDASGRWYQLSVRPYVTLDQRIDGAVVAAVDVDASTRGMARLAQAQTYAEQIVETVREPLAVLERDLTVRSVNEAFLRAFALEPQEPIGRPLNGLGREALADVALVGRLAGLAEGDAFDGLRVPSHASNGGGRTYVANARHIAGTPRILLALEDVTEAELAARAVEQAEVSLRDTLLHAASAILLVDRAGRMVFVNGAAAAMFGYAVEELTGQTIELLVPERYRAGHVAHREAYVKAPTARRLGAERELHGRRKDGTEFPVDISLSPASRSEEARVVAFVRDLTEQKDAERRIHESQDKLQQMDFDRALTEERERRRIAVELHDRIGQSLALAQIKLTTARDAVTGALQASLDEVVSLLDQSVAETRTLTFELSPPILYDLGLKEALSWLAEDIEHRYGIRVEVRDDDQQMPLDDTSRALVFRAVRELLMNVFKHAKTPSAKVEVRRVDDRFDIVVEDSGVGFDVDGAARQGGGFGLLSVREQMRRLGGRLEIVSKPSLGTKVTLQMPIAEPPPSTKETP